MVEIALHCDSVTYRWLHCMNYQAFDKDGSLTNVLFYRIELSKSTKKIRLQLLRSSVSRPQIFNKESDARSAVVKAFSVPQSSGEHNISCMRLSGGTPKARHETYFALKFEILPSSLIYSFNVASFWQYLITWRAYPLMRDAGTEKNH